MSIFGPVLPAGLLSIGTGVARRAQVAFIQQPQVTEPRSSTLAKKPTVQTSAKQGYLATSSPTQQRYGCSAASLFHHHRYHLTLHDRSSSLRGSRVWGPIWAPAWGYTLTTLASSHGGRIATGRDSGIWGIWGLKQRHNLHSSFDRMFPWCRLHGRAYQLYAELSLSQGAEGRVFNVNQTSVLRLTVSNEQNRLRGILTSYKPEPVLAGMIGDANDLTLTEVPASSLAAMFGYARRYQKTPFIRLSLFKHLRRYFLILEQLRVDLAIRGTMRHFRMYFKALNQPLTQVLQNPVSGAFIPDFALEIGSKDSIGVVGEGLESRVCAMLQESLPLGTQTSLGSASDLSENETLKALTLALTGFFRAELEKAHTNLVFRDVILHRYRLCWEQVFFQKIVEHCLRKKKKARSIKKRRTKRLVSKTKYRFWAL